MSASPPAMVQACTEFDTAGACVSSVWMPYTPGGLPPLSIEDAQTIALAIALLWAVAWGIRMVKRVLQENA